MLLTLDIGNTNIKTGLFVDGVLRHSWRLSADISRTADELGVLLDGFFLHLGLNMRDVKGIIVSSVLPGMNYTIDHMINIYFPGIKPLQVHAGLRTDLHIHYDSPQYLGSDRICNAVAARKLYGGNIITIDFGTATTFGVLREDHFLGGMICPGFKVSSTALVNSAAMLPKVEYINPGSVIGTSTQHCIQSGILFGYVGLVEYLVQKAKAELQAPARVIATGGMSELVANETDCIEVINPTLTLLGLQMIYEMNK